VPAYEPPEQSRRGQLVDAATVLVLIFATLFVTTWIAQGSTTAPADAPWSERPVADLPVNLTEQAQYQRLIDSGITDLAAVNAAVEATRNQSDKYDINPWALLGTAAVLAAYLAYVYRTSFREYREVVEERFGPRSEQESDR
jgi:hypothetical protein